MRISHQFAIMSLHAGQKNYHEVCANYLSHSAISSIDSGKGSLCCLSKFRNDNVALSILVVYPNDYVTWEMLKFVCDIKYHYAWLNMVSALRHVTLSAFCPQPRPKRLDLSK